MSSGLRRYLLWVLLPAALAFTIGQRQIHRSLLRQASDSTQRFGRMAGLLFEDEMASTAASMAERASVLPDPDPTTPVVQAALRGDTVAALGTLADEVVLSVALLERAGAESEDPGAGEGRRSSGRTQGESSGRTGEEPSDTLRIRALTEAFPATFLTRLRSRAGHVGALYLRGRRVASSPPDFGPGTLSPDTLARSSGRWAPLATPLGQAHFQPIGAQPGAPAQLHLLVAPNPPFFPTAPLWRGALTLALGSGLGLGFLFLGRLGSVRRRLSRHALSRTSSLVSCGLALSGLWGGLLVPTGSILKELTETRSEEMVRALALFSEGGGTRGPRALAEAAGFGVSLLRPGDTAISTEAPSVLQVISELPPPGPSFPSTGTADVEEREEVRFASSRLSSGEVLVLTTAAEEGGAVRLRLALAGLAGGASLFALGFLNSSRLPPHQGGEQPEESDAPGP